MDDQNILLDNTMYRVHYNVDPGSSSVIFSAAFDLSLAVLFVPGFAGPAASYSLQVKNCHILSWFKDLFVRECPLGRREICFPLGPWVISPVTIRWWKRAELMKYLYFSSGNNLVKRVSA